MMKTAEESNSRLKKAKTLLQEDAPVWCVNETKDGMAHQARLTELQQDAAELAVQSYEKLWVDDTVPSGR